MMLFVMVLCSIVVDVLLFSWVCVVIVFGYVCMLFGTLLSVWCACCGLCCCGCVWLRVRFGLLGLCLLLVFWCSHDVCVWYVCVLGC